MYRNTSRVNLNVCRICEYSTLAVARDSSCTVTDVYKRQIWGVGKSIRYTLSLTNDAATIGWDVTDVDKWADEDNQEKDPVAPAV